MPRKSPIAIFASLDVAEKAFCARGGLEKTLKRMRGQSSGSEGACRRGCGRNILGADNDFPRLVKDREHVIAKAMFGDGYPTGEFERIRAALIVHFRIESGKKSFGEFGEIHVGALEGAPPENKISDQRENNQNQRQYHRVPEREPEANRIKHGPSGRKKPP